MNHEQINDGQEQAGAGKVNVFDMLIVLARYRRLLLIFPLVIGAIAAVVAFMLPPVFRASATLLPPQQAQSGASLLAQLGGADGLLAGAAGIKSPAEVYVGMLKSRTVADSLIKKFDLMNVYEIPSMERTRLALAVNTSITTGKDGTITIAVEDKDKARSANLANAYTLELTNLTKVLAVTSAGQRRMFYEKQLEQAKDTLAASESKLKSLLNKGGVISVDADSKVILETIGRLRARISAKEIELSAMKSFVTSNNQDYKRAEEELQSLRAGLDRLENGAANTAEAAISRENSGLGNIQLLRDVKYHQMLYELLAKQYEVARLEEAKEGPLIQVLDEALQPEHKFKPKRALLILMALLAAELAALAYVFIRESVRSAKRRPDVSLKVAELRKSMGR